ncbi:MAG: VOC family protein, partial [Candidatus Binatia bacterium]
MRIRQVVFVAAELDRLVEDLCAVLGTAVGFNDPGVKEFGLRNAVLPLGDQFVEVVSPVEEWAPAKRYLERRKGDGGYMLILQMDDLDRDEKRLEELGVRVVWKADLPEIRGRHLHPKDTGGTLLSLDQPRVAAEWPWAGPRWKEVRQSGAVRKILAVEIQAEDPEPLARRWG